MLNRKLIFIIVLVFSLGFSSSYLKVSYPIDCAFHDTSNISKCPYLRPSIDTIHTRMDITDIVQMWVDGTLTNYGLILMPLEESNRFLKLHANPQLLPNAKAKVRIFSLPPQVNSHII